MPKKMKMFFEKTPAVTRKIAPGKMSRVLEYSQAMMGDDMRGTNASIEAKSENRAPPVDFESDVLDKIDRTVTLVEMPSTPRPAAKYKTQSW